MKFMIMTMMTMMNMCSVISMSCLLWLLTVPRHPEIAAEISFFVNKHKCFPDYEDILHIVQDCSAQSVRYLRGLTQKMSAKMTCDKSQPPHPLLFASKHIPPLFIQSSAYFKAKSHYFM